MTDVSTIIQFMALVSPLVSLAVVFGGIRYQARASERKDMEQDEALAQQAGKIADLRVDVATLQAQTTGLVKHIDERFDTMSRQLSEIFRRLNQD